MKIFPVVNYERQIELARTTHAPVKLDYYRFLIVVWKGEITSKDMHWLLTTKLGLEVHTMTHPETTAAGINDK